MMRGAILAVLLLWPSLGLSKVLNVEYNFAAYTGDLKTDEVELVPGTVRLFVNGVPRAEQEQEKRKVPVMFDEREVSGAVWAPMASMGAVVRKGKNTIRIEFVPTDPKASYRTQLRWASVTDQVRESEGAEGQHRSTNQDAEGAEDKAVTGPVTVERTFEADFAKDLPWHHYPAVTALGDDDKAKLVALVKERGDWFKPDFAPIYKFLSGREDVKVGELKKHRCLEAAYKAGIRLQAPATEQLDFLTTGNPEVVVARKGGGPMLYDADRSAFDKIKGDEMKMCAGIALSIVYPPALVAVRSPDGAWSVAY